MSGVVGKWEWGEGCGGKGWLTVNLFNQFQAETELSRSKTNITLSPILV